MKAIYRGLVYFLFAFGGLHGCSDSSDSPSGDTLLISQAKAAAMDVLDFEIEARNKLDAELLSQVNNYPMVRFSAGTTLTFPDPEFYRLIEERFSTPNFLASEWHYSEFEERRITHASPSKVHIASRIARYNSNNIKYFSADTLWIVTKQGDRWGAKIRSSWTQRPNITDETVYAAAESAAKKVLQDYVDARNNRDSEALAALAHYPLFFLAGAELKNFDTAEEYIVFEETTVIHDLDYTQWDHSNLSKVEVIQSGADKVHLAAKIDNLNVEEKAYGSEEDLWIVIKKDDRWGLRARSYF